MGRSSMAVGLEMLLVHVAFKETSWAAVSCSHETISWMEKVSAQFLGVTVIFHPFGLWEDLLVVVQHEVVALSFDLTDCLTCLKILDENWIPPMEKQASTWKGNSSPNPAQNTNLGIPALGSYFQMLSSKTIRLHQPFLTSIYLHFLLAYSISSLSTCPMFLHFWIWFCLNSRKAICEWWEFDGQ